MYRLALIVEDDPPVRRAIRRCVARYADEVLEVEDLASAFRALNRRPDLITLDLEFPDGRGDAVLGKICDWNTPPIVVVISGNGSPRQAFELSCYGISAYLEKPWTPDELDMVLKAADSKSTGAIRNSAARWVGRSGLTETVVAVRDSMVREALRRSGGNRTLAATILGVTRQTIQAHLHRWSDGGDEL